MTSIFEMLFVCKCILTKYQNWYSENYVEYIFITYGWSGALLMDTILQPCCGNNIK